MEAALLEDMTGLGWVARHDGLPTHGATPFCYSLRLA